MHIILIKKVHMRVFFICLFLFSKNFMSKYNIYFLKKSNESYDKRMKKSAEM